MEPREIGRLRPRAAALALVGALVTAFAAQYVFTGEAFTRLRDSVTWVWEPRYSAGSVLLLVAIALAVWSGRRDEAEPAPPVASPRTGGRAVVLGRRDVPRAHGPRDRPVPRRGASRGPYARCGASRCCPSWSRSSSWRSAGRASPRWAPRSGRRGKHPFLLGVTFAGFFLRFTRITELPDHVDNDVALMGVETLRMMRRHDPSWFGLAASRASPLEPPAPGPRIPTFRGRPPRPRDGVCPRGDPHAARALRPRAGGVLAARRHVATVLLATSYTHIHFSRILFGPTATFLLCLSFAHLFRAFRTGRALNWAAGGLAMGISLLTYDSSRVGPAIVLAFLAVERRPEQEGRARAGRRMGPLLHGCLRRIRADDGLHDPQPDRLHRTRKHGDDLEPGNPAALDGQVPRRLPSRGAARAGAENVPDASPLRGRERPLRISPADGRSPGRRAVRPRRRHRPGPPAARFPPPRAPLGGPDVRPRRRPDGRPSVLAAPEHRSAGRRPPRGAGRRPAHARRRALHAGRPHDRSRGDGARSRRRRRPRLDRLHPIRGATTRDGASRPPVSSTPCPRKRTSTSSQTTSRGGSTASGSSTETWRDGTSRWRTSCRGGRRPRPGGRTP